MNGVTPWTRRAVSVLAFTSLAAAAGCGGTSQKHSDAAPEVRPAAESKAPPAPGLIPGPPDAATAPRSKDPEVRAVEDRLFLTDGGRVVLKAIRVQGGWERWREVTRVTALVKSEKGAERRLVYTPERQEGQPLETLALAAPFSLADPAFRYDYQGVEFDAGAGDSFDKVQVTQPGAEGRWLVVYVSRRTGILSRVLLPRQAEGGTPGEVAFERIDLSRQREAGGVLLATSWTHYPLRHRLARADLTHPSAVEELELQVTSR